MRSNVVGHGARFAVLLGWLLLVFAGPGQAADGRLEIDQTCAVNTGCFAGDGAGFPVTISSAGSYLLTGDLVPGHNQDGIRINASDVTVDLNGFSVVSSSSDSTSANGVEAFDRESVEVKNGTVRGFRGRGVAMFGASVGCRIIDIRVLDNGFQGIDLDGTGHLASRCTAVNNGFAGITADGGSMVIDSVVKDNTGFGLVLDSTTGYRGNVIDGNNGGNANAQVLGGVEMGVNLCGGSTTCP